MYHIFPMRLFYLFLLSLMLGITTCSWGQTPVLNPCIQQQAKHIVVIGSSTAAGTGPSQADSAWVNRYRAYLQSINTQNQVTNLAIGGTTTYHIMPTWYSPPANRPNRNPNNNISQAISLGADAIIVNMPSNDAANNFSLSEQISNFRTLQQSADSVGIPVWICTTQPRNFSMAQRALQVAVRDSILAVFAPRAIDFWSGTADSLDGILPIYDSGDGVHLNDAGHALLFQRVVHQAIPWALADTLTQVDYQIQLFPIDPSIGICGDSQTLLPIVIGNLGTTGNSPINFRVAVQTTLGQVILDTLLQSAAPLASCASDTFLLSLNTYAGVHWQYYAYLTSTDSFPANDTTAWELLFTTGHPSIWVQADTVCLGDSSILSAYALASHDTVFWYDAPVGGQLVAAGNHLSIPNLQQNQTFYPQVVRGPTVFVESLGTSPTTTTNWNGIMFDLVAKDSLTIDSLETKFFSLGAQGVVAYIRLGSYQGFEGNPNAWILWGTDSIEVLQAGDFHRLHYPSIELEAGDTLAIYLHLQDGAARLSYLASSSPIVYQTPELALIRGSGVSHTFGTTYTPRNFTGRIFYHHGFNPLGDCRTPRTVVQAVVSMPQLNLGADTLLQAHQNLLLTAPSEFQQWLWSDSSTTNQLYLDSNNANFGANLIWLEASNAWGCTARDSMVVTFIQPTNSTSINNIALTYFPNPVQDVLQIRSATPLKGRWLVYDLMGQCVKSFDAAQQALDLSELPQGQYLFLLVGGNKPLQFRVSTI